jgi:hypothetical protein
LAGLKWRRHNHMASPWAASCTDTSIDTCTKMPHSNIICTLINVSLRALLKLGILRIASAALCAKRSQKHTQKQPLKFQIQAPWRWAAPIGAGRASHIERADTYRVRVKKHLRRYGPTEYKEAGRRGTLDHRIDAQSIAHWVNRLASSKDTPRLGRGCRAAVG